MSIYKINSNLPRIDQITTLNNMIIELNGKLSQLSSYYLETLALKSVMPVGDAIEYNIALGNTISTYSDWSHVYAATGYSIWKIQPSNFTAFSLNQMFVDDKLIEYRGLATAESTISFDSVFLYNGSYTDNTTEAGSEDGTAFNLMAGTGDYLYIGDAAEFSGINFDFATIGSNYTLKIEYWSGSAWTELSSTTNTLIDNTSNFISDGLVTWETPTDWALTTVNSTIRYWIRISTTTTPLITASAYKVCTKDSVVDLLSLSSSEILNEEWAWCYYNNYVYVTIRNTGNSTYEGDYYITSSSSATNKQNFFVYNHEYKMNYLSSNWATYTVVTDASYSMDGTLWRFLLDASSNSITFTLPSANDYEGKEIIIKTLTIGSGNTITIEPQSGELIDGSGSYTGLTTDYKYIKLWAANLNWYIIGSN